MQEIEYVLVPKTTLDAHKISSEHTLTLEEVQILSIHKDVIKKFILQKGLSMQFDIGSGLWQGRELLGFEVIKTLAEIATEVGNIDTVFEKYIEQEKIKEEQRKQKEEEEKKKN